MKNKKRLVLSGSICLALLLLAIPLLMSGCTSTEPEPKPTPTPAPAPVSSPEPAAEQTPEPAPAPEPVSLNVATWGPPMHCVSRNMLTPFIEEMAERTDGQVEMTLYTGSALGGGAELFDLTKQGAVDISYTLLGYTPGRFPLSSVIELPFLCPSSTVASKVFWDLYEEFPEIQAEYEGTKVLTLWTTDPNQIHTIDKAVYTPEDLEGLTLRVPNEIMGKMLAKCGATSLVKPMGETYLLLERGVADGACFTLEAVKGFKMQEVVGHTSVLNPQVLAEVLVMSQDSWDNLPPNIQEIFEEEFVGGYLGSMGSKSHELDKDMGLQTLQEANREVISFTEEECQVWESLFESIRTDWASEIDADGLPGTAILNRAIELSKQYSQ